MNALKIAALTAVLVAGAAGVGDAQVSAGLGFGSGLGQIGAGSWLRESRLTPSLRYATGMGFLRLDASALERAGSLSLERALVDAAASSPAFGPLRFTMTGQFRDARFDTTQIASLGSALSVKHGPAGVWVGSTHERSAMGQLHWGAWGILRSVLVSVTNRSRSTGIWEKRPFKVTRTVETDSGSQQVEEWVDRGFMNRSRRWSDLEGRFDWAGGRIALSATMTRSTLPAFDSLSRSRAVLSGTVYSALRLNERLSLVSTVGTRPTVARADASESRFATIGIRFAPAALLREPPPAAIRPAASAFRLLPLEEGVYRVVLRVPGARTVDISGDFNQWKPVALTQTRPDVWEVALPLVAGTHRVNVRVDGDRWTAPPGLPSVDDEFSGRVGLLVVR